MKLSQALECHVLMIRRDKANGECKLSVKLGDVTWHRRVLPLSVLDDHEALTLNVSQLCSPAEGDLVYHLSHGCERGLIIRVDVTVTAGTLCQVAWPNGTANVYNGDELHYA